MIHEKRKYIRTKLTSSVKLSHPDTGTIEVVTKDISDGGIYLITSNSKLPEVGSEVKVQLIDTPFEAPKLDMKIIRLENIGLGLAFLE